MSRSRAWAFLFWHLAVALSIGDLILLLAPKVDDAAAATLRYVQDLVSADLTDGQLAFVTALVVTTIALLGNWVLKSREFRNARADRMTAAATDFLNAMEALEDAYTLVRDVHQAMKEVRTWATDAETARETDELVELATKLRAGDDTVSREDLQARTKALNSKTSASKKRVKRAQRLDKALPERLRQLTKVVQAAGLTLSLNGGFWLRRAADRSIDSIRELDALEDLPTHIDDVLRGVRREVTRAASRAVGAARSWWGRRLALRVHFIWLTYKEDWQRALKALSKSAEPTIAPTTGQEPATKPE